MRNENVISRVAAFLVVALLLMSQTGFANDYNDRVQVTFERVGREYHGIIRDTLRKNADWSDVFESGILSQRASVDIYVNPESIIALIPYEYSEEKSLLFVERGPLAEWVEDDEAYVFDVSVIDPLMRIVIDSLLKASKEAGLDNYYPVVIVGLRNLWNGGMLVASLTYKPVGVDSLLGGKYTHTRWAYTYDPEFLITVPQGSYTIKRGVQWFEGKRLFTSKEVKRDTYSTVQPLLWFLDLNEADIPTLKSLPNFLKPLMP